MMKVIGNFKLKNSSCDSVYFRNSSKYQHSFDLEIEKHKKDWHIRGMQIC